MRRRERGGPRLTPSAHLGCSGNSVRRRGRGGPPTYPLCPLGVLREQCEETGTWGPPTHPLCPLGVLREQCEETGPWGPRGQVSPHNLLVPLQASVVSQDEVKVGQILDYMRVAGKDLERA